MLFFFQNGKAAKVELSAYKTLQRRKKLLNAFSDKSPVIAFFQIREDAQFLLRSTSGRMLIVDSGAIPPKVTKNTQGIAVMSLTKNAALESAVPFAEGMLASPHRFFPKSLPSTGALPRPEDIGEQLTL